MKSPRLLLQTPKDCLRFNNAVIPEFFSALTEKYPGSRNKCNIVNSGSGSRLSAALGRDDRLFLYVDGKFPVPNISLAQQAVIDGDNKILSVAAASIIAKVYRDNLMKNYHKKYPTYNFAQHKGYATFHHRQMVAMHGLSKIHRKTFCKNIKTP